MNISIAIQRYQMVYSKLYKRDPLELRDLGSGWVLVNGARMQVGELEKLTEQMQAEYRQITAEKRGVIQRLISWLREN